MHRRRFLAESAALSLGCGLLGHPFPSPAPIRVGQIGTGHAHAAGQMSTLRASKDYEVVGVVEPDPAQWARVKDTAAYADLPRLTQQELLDSPGLQVVAVETEIAQLLPTAQRCVEAGMHIHLDKPAGDSLEQLQALHRVAAQQKRVIQMGYMFRYNAGFQLLHQAVAEGWLGEIFEVHAVMSKTASDADRRIISRYPGGAMFELGCHLIDPLLKLMGPPTEVTPFLRSTRPADELRDNTLAVFEYPRATATIRSALVEVDGFRRRQFVVCGTEGTLVIRRLEPPHVELTLSRARGPYAQGTQVIELPAPRGRYEGAWEALARAVRGEQPLEYSQQHDFDVQRAVLAASGMRAWN